MKKYYCMLECFEVSKIGFGGEWKESYRDDENVLMGIIFKKIDFEFRDFRNWGGWR